RTAAALHGRPAPAPPRLTPAQRRLARDGAFVVDLTPGRESSRDAATVTVVAPDRLGLLARTAGVLALHRLDVRAATVETVGSAGVGVWTVLPRYGDLPDPAVLREDLRRAIEGAADIGALLARRDAAQPRRPGAPTGGGVAAPAVEVVAGACDTATVLEVRAQDRPGLLYRVGRVLEHHGVDVRRAHANTLGPAAVDVFYVVDARGDGRGRPLDDTRADAVARAVGEALR
ncbi:MAG: ACT domain-containing protein, partial [Streptomycetales bacterium]